jgi:hypothetical protein
MVGTCWKEVAQWILRRSVSPEVRLERLLEHFRKDAWSLPYLLERIAQEEDERILMAPELGMRLLDSVRSSEQLLEILEAGREAWTRKLCLVPDQERTPDPIKDWEDYRKSFSLRVEMALKLGSRSVRGREQLLDLFRVARSEFIPGFHWSRHSNSQHRLSDWAPGRYSSWTFGRYSGWTPAMRSQFLGYPDEVLW